MAKVVKLVGRTSDFKGKPLWEIIGNLKNFGVGRLVYRQMLQRYPEPSFMKIIKVEAQPNPTDPYEARKVKVLIENTFRGRKSNQLIQLLSTSYKADYQLIPKANESEWIKCAEAVPSPAEKILPATIEFPPLLREFIAAETGSADPKMPTKILKFKRKTVRVAKDGEKPNIFITMGLGKPASPNLYKGLDL